MLQKAKIITATPNPLTSPTPSIPRLPPAHQFTCAEPAQKNTSPNVPSTSAISQRACGALPRSTVGSRLPSACAARSSGPAIGGSVPSSAHIRRAYAAPAPHPSFLRPSPSFLRRQEPTHPHIPHPVPNSSLPPTRGEVRWGVGGPERPPAAERQPAPSKTHPHFRHSCAPPSFLRRQEPATSAAITQAPHWCKVTPVNHTANLPTAAQRARRAAAALTRSGGGGG